MVNRLWHGLWRTFHEPTVPAAVLSGLALLADWIPWGAPLPLSPSWLAVVLCGAPIVRSGIGGLIRDRKIGSDLLVTIAIGGSAAIGELFAAGEVAFIMAVGMLLEERTVRKATSAVTDLIDLTPREARVLRDGSEQVVPVDQVHVGELLLVKPGEIIPVDGVVVSGQSTADQSAITGESVPADKQPGDPVFGGTTNQLGALTVRATGVGEETTLSRVAALVSQAQLRKAPVERLADRWASWIVPSSLAFALLVFAFTRDLVRAVTILIVFCPCALVLGTPTAIAAGIGSAARRGILVKSGAALEAAGRIDVVLLDKTGTLTRGALQVVNLYAHDSNTHRLLETAATAECFSEHPLADAIVSYARQESAAPQGPSDFQVIVGQGVRAVWDGRQVLVGNRALMELENVAVPAQVAEWQASQENAGRTVVLVALRSAVLGALAIADTVREGAADLVAALRQAGIETAMMTGDAEKVAAAIATQVGIAHVGAQMMPETKYMGVSCLSRAGRRVCMVGDGINDAPALARADLGVAMGQGGTHIAAESADVTLMSGDLRRLPELFLLGRRTLGIIRQNIVGATILNGIAVALAALGILGPVMGALVHNLGSVLVVLNSARLIRGAGFTAPVRRRTLTQANR